MSSSQGCKVNLIFLELAFEFALAEVPFHMVTIALQRVQGLCKVLRGAPGLQQTKLSHQESKKPHTSSVQ